MSYRLLFLAKSLAPIQKLVKLRRRVVKYDLRYQCHLTSGIKCCGAIDQALNSTFMPKIGNSSFFKCFARF